MRCHVTFPALAIAFLATGCGSKSVWVAPEAYAVADPVVVATVPDSMWPAIIDVVTELELEIELISRASGYLKTDRIVVPFREDHWDCGHFLENSRSEPYAPKQVEAEIGIAIVPLGDGQSRLQATTYLLNESCVSRGVFEAELLDSIVTRWKELSGRL